MLVKRGKREEGGGERGGEGRRERGSGGGGRGRGREGEDLVHCYRSCRLRTNVKEGCVRVEGQGWKKRGLDEDQGQKNGLKICMEAGQNRCL